MKVQCSCGAKHRFEITPEMRTNPVRFICPACGVDASEFVDGLVRQELGQSASPAGRVIQVRALAEAPLGPAVARSGPEIAMPPAASSGPLRVRITTPQ